MDIKRCVKTNQNRRKDDQARIDAIHKLTRVVSQKTDHSQRYTVKGDGGVGSRDGSLPRLNFDSGLIGIISVPVLVFIKANVRVDQRIGRRAGFLGFLGWLLS